MVPAAIDVRRFPPHVPLGCRPVIAMSTVTSASVVLLSNPFPRLPEPERPACPAVACDRLVDVGTASSWGCGGRSGRCRFARPCLGVFPHRRRPSRRCLPAYAGPPPALARFVVLWPPGQRWKRQRRTPAPIAGGTSMRPRPSRPVLSPVQPRHVHVRVVGCLHGIEPSLKTVELPVENPEPDGRLPLRRAVGPVVAPSADDHRRLALAHGDRRVSAISDSLPLRAARAAAGPTPLTSVETTARAHRSRQRSPRQSAAADVRIRA